MTNPNDLIRRGDALKEANKLILKANPMQEAAICAYRAAIRNLKPAPHPITVTCDDDSTDRGPVWIATHLGSGITAEARTPADAVSLCADRVPREAWYE